MQRLIVITVMFFAWGAQAHKPSFSDGEFKSLESAWQIENIATSIVLYHQVTCDSGHLWLEFDSIGDEDLFVQLGVPVIDRLSYYRPSVAILAPGLPTLTETVPFDVPDGLGGVVYHSGPVETPEDFYEPFSQTESWILLETTKRIQESGTGYVVAWDPSGMTGKLWVAVGTVEDFSDVAPTDFSSWLEQTQAYHETGPYSDADVTEVTCRPQAPSGSSENAASDANGDAASGCQTAHHDTRPSLLFLVMMLVAATAFGRQRRLSRSTRMRQNRA